MWLLPLNTWDFILIGSRVGEMSKGPVECASCNIAITLTDNDLLLGSKPHNCPFFVISCIRE